MVDGGVKSAKRAFEILEVFDHCRRPLSLKEVTDELGYPASSGSALLKSLLEQGYLDYDRERRLYMPTMRVALLGGWVQDTLFGHAGLLSAMQDLHDAAHDAVILGAQSDLHVLYLHLIYSDEPLQYRGKPGLRRPLALSGMGWALLAEKDDDEIDLLIRRINAKGEGKVDSRQLMERIEEVRVEGYAFSKHTVSEGVGLIAMVMPKQTFGRVFSLAVAGYVPRLEAREEEIVAHLRATIAQLSLADAKESA